MGDVLLRRTRLGLLAARELLDEDGRRPRRRSGRARTLGQELGWDDARVEREIAGFASEAAAEGILVSASIGARP